jgi:sarcosine oxidase
MWQAEEGRMRADVIVVGLGSMGASAAYALAARGLRVIGLDRFTPPHDRGAHGGGSRIIRMAYMEGAEYVPLVERSYQMWRELETSTGQSLLTVTGGLMLGLASSEAVSGALATVRAHTLPHELLDGGEVRRRFPGFAPADDEVGLFEEIAGLIRPERAIAAHLGLARSHGADLRTGVAVEDWRADFSGVAVTTADGVIEADRLVLAPGAWAPELTRLRVPLRVERRVQHYWRASRPELFVVGRLPVWIWEYKQGEAAYGLPELDGAVKAALHHGHELVDPDIGPEAGRQQEIATMRGWLASHLPSLADGAWVGSKPCLYTLTPDEHFVLGPHPGYPNVWVACGFSGHGFKFTPVVGEILADLVTTGTTPHPIDLFHPDRTSAQSTSPRSTLRNASM